METIVTEISVGIAYYQDLHDWVKSFDINPDDEMFEPLSLMEGDPDIIRCSGRKLYFITTVQDGVQYVLTSDEVNDQEKKMLTEFHQDDFKENYSVGECNWETFNDASNAIAYRGGSGYCYTIWIYTPKNNQNELSKAS